MDGEVFGRYRLLEVIGRGGMGTVYLAHDTTMSRDVAVKVLPPELAAEPGYQERFRREAHIVARLNHPNIIPIHDFGEIDGRLYLVMPIVDGIDVDSLLRRDGPMSPMLAVRVIEQVAAALDAAHKSGLVHRDVKPMNVLIVGGEFAYLIDFGIAASATAGGLIRADVIVGTWPYMAPERFGSVTVDSRSDIYSLACVLFECLTGRKAVVGDSIEQFFDGHLHKEPPKPTDVDSAIPVGLDEVIARGMAKVPDERYQSARELAAAARDALTPQVVSAHGGEFGRYRLLEQIGRGGMGRVYRARDTAMGRDVAVKVLPPELATEPGYQERFRREANAAGRLASPNIIPVYDAGEIDGRLYLVMPIIDGVDVRARLERDGPLSPQLAVRVIEQAAAALDTAHTAGLVHRDVKPSNLLMTDGDSVYLIDFGIAHDAAASRLTRTNAPVGSWAYMAPERFNKGKIDGRGDVYSLACTLYECLTGQLPFRASSHEQLVVAHLYTEPPKPSSVNPAIPSGFDEVIARGMAKNADDRYQTATELAVAAGRALDGSDAPVATQTVVTDPIDASAPTQVGGATTQEATTDEPSR